MQAKSKNIIIGILFTVAACILPLVINFLVTRPKFFAVAGDEGDWLSFWSTYISSVASAMMLYIALKNIVENHKENSDNRLLQVRMMAYQQEKDRLDKLADKLWIFQSSFDMMEVMHQVDHLRAEDPDYEEIFKQLKILVRDVDKSDFAIDLLLPKTSKDKYEAAYNETRNEIYGLYGYLIADLNSLCEFYQNYPKDRAKQDSYVKFHLSTTLTEPRTPLTEVIHKWKNQDLIAHKNDILKDLVSDTSSQIADLKEQLKVRIYDLITFKNTQLEKGFYSHI